MNDRTTFDEMREADLMLAMKRARKIIGDEFCQQNWYEQVSRVLKAMGAGHGIEGIKWERIDHLVATAIASSVSGEGIETYGTASAAGQAVLAFAAATRLSHARAWYEGEFEGIAQGDDLMFDALSGVVSREWRKQRENTEG